MARGPGADGAPAWSAANREPCASWARVLPCSQPAFRAELPVFLILALALLLSGGPDRLLSAVGVLMLLLHAFRALNSCAKSESPNSLALVHSAQGAMGSSDDKEPSFPLSPLLSLKQPDSSAELEVLLTLGLLFYLVGAPAVVLFVVGVPAMILAVVRGTACHADLEPSATWAQVHSVDGAPASRPAAEPRSSSAPGFSVGDTTPSAELDIFLPVAAMVSLVQTPVLAFCVGAALYIVLLLVEAPISHTPSWSAPMGPDSTIVSDLRREDTAASDAERECPRSSTPVLGLLSTAAGNTCALVLAQDSAAAWRPQQESHNCLAMVKEQAPSTSGHSELDWAAVHAQESCHHPVVGRETGCNQKVPPALIAVPQLMSEQLTRMDMELFEKAEPIQCLLYNWSRRYSKGKLHLAPSIRAILIHFNNVVSLVKTLCLGDLNTSASVRARLLEFWIQVAKGCLILRNFSSLHAIMSALQNRAIWRLHSSWQQVSRKDLFTFHKLAEITSPENNYSKSRELLLKETSKLAAKEKLLKGCPRESQKMAMSNGIIPYLRIILKDFILIQMDYENNKNERSKEKKLIKENEIIKQMKELQHSCRFYNIRVDHHFTKWFRGLERLSKNASYELSCALEPCRPTGCPRKKCSSIGKAGKNGGSQPIQKTFPPRTTKKHRVRFSLPPT